MTYGGPDWATVLILALAGASVLYDRFQNDPDPVEEAERAFANGDISRAELERRLELHLDDRNDRIRETVKEAPGIGPDTSAAIARQFDSVADLADADREELLSIAGVGEQRVDAIQQYLDG